MATIELKDHPRLFLGPEFNPADPAGATALFEELEQRPLPDLAALERWIADIDEVRTAIDEERSRRFIDSTCDTSDPAVTDAYNNFVAVMDPIVKEHGFRLEKRLVESPHAKRLDRRRYGQFLEDVAMRIRLYRPENVPLQVEESRLDTEYQKVYGATKVSFEGAEHPLSRMKVYNDDLSRARREGAWRATQERVAKDAETYEGLLDTLVDLRTRVARNAGCRDFVEYRFLQFRRPYKPADCRRFHDAVERRVVPVLERIQSERQRRLGVPSLRPWDLGVDPLGRAPLRPYRDERELVSLVRRAFGRLDPEFGSRIEWMERSKLLDLDARAGKAPGGYMCQLDERRVPFIFMNSAGIQQDVNTMLHEGGHAFHCFETRDLEPAFNRSAPIEFCEVASMSMELLGLDVIEYASADAVRRARREHLEDIVRILGWICTIDRFQLDLYERPEHSRAERKALWLDSFRRFRGRIDYSGLETAEANRWHLQSHIFGNALYYIEYAIAQLGALQVWRNFRRDPGAGVRAYRKGLALGNTEPLPRLFEAAGAKFDFGDSMLGELMDFVAEEIAGLA